MLFFYVFKAFLAPAQAFYLFHFYSYFLISVFLSSSLHRNSYFRICFIMMFLVGCCNIAVPTFQYVICNMKNKTKREG